MNFVTKKIIIIFLFFLYPTVSYAYIVGVCGHPEGYSKSSASYVDLLKEYKVQSFRTDYSWKTIEREKGVFNVDGYKTDEVLMLGLKNRIVPLIILDYGNPIYNIKKPTTPDEIKKFSDYAAWVANRFKNNGVIYEVWNEWPHNTKDYKNEQSKNSALRYYNLVKEVSSRIKSIDPSAVILGGGLNPIDGKDTEWGLFLIKFGIMDYLDGISIHPYSYSSRRIADPDYNLKRISDVHSYYSRYNKNKKEIDFFITEIGYSNYNGGVGFSKDDVEGYLKKYIESSRKISFIKGLWWYDFIDDGGNVNNIEHNFGILNRDLKSKPAGEVFRNIHK